MRQVPVLDKCFKFTYSRDMGDIGLNPYFQEVESNHGPEVVINGHKMIMTGSNNYLGLATDRRVCEAAKKAVDDYGTSLTGSRFLNGSCNLHAALEEELADFLYKESALVFTTGMQANIGVISALMDRQTVAIIDKLDHASIYDGVKLGNGVMARFNHNDTVGLGSAIAKHSHGSCVVVVDGVFSMEGDIAPLNDIAKIVNPTNACLIVDDAHAIGTIGATGRGSVEYHEKGRDIDIIVGTFSKSLASIGGFAAGPKEVMEYIRYHARSMIFSCGLPPSNAAAALAALRILREEPQLVSQASKMADRMRAGLRSLGYELTDSSSTPIVSIIIGDDFKVCSLWAELCSNGVFTNVVIGPATTPGRQLIRTSFMASHTEKHIDFVLEQFDNAGKKLGLLNGNKQFGSPGLAVG